MGLLNFTYYLKNNEKILEFRKNLSWLLCYACFFLILALPQNIIVRGPISFERTEGGIGWDEYVIAKLVNYSLHTDHPYLPKYGTQWHAPYDPVTLLIAIIFLLVAFPSDYSTVSGIKESLEIFKHLWIIPPVVGTFSLLAAYLFTQQMLNRRKAQLATALIATTPGFVIWGGSCWVSQTFGFLFMFLSLYMLVRENYPIVGLFMTSLFFTHPGTLIIFLILVLVLVANRKTDTKNFLCSLATFLVLTTPLFLLYYETPKLFILGHTWA